MIKFCFFFVHILSLDYNIVENLALRASINLNIIGLNLIIESVHYGKLYHL